MKWESGARRESRGQGKRKWGERQKERTVVCALAQSPSAFLLIPLFSLAMRLYLAPFTTARQNLLKNFNFGTFGGGAVLQSNFTSVNQALTSSAESYTKHEIMRAYILCCLCTRNKRIREVQIYANLAKLELPSCFQPG